MSDITAMVRVVAVSPFSQRRKRQLAPAVAVSVAVVPELYVPNPAILHLSLLVLPDIVNDCTNVFQCTMLSSVVSLFVQSWSATNTLLILAV